MLELRAGIVGAGVSAAWAPGVTGVGVDGVVGVA